MRPRRLGLTLVAWSVLLTPTLALAQTLRLGPQPPQNPGERPSHRPIRGGLEDDPSPEKRLANRLRKGQVDDDMKELAKKLLQDKDLVESLRKSIKPEDIERFRQRVGDGKGWADDPALRQLIQEGMKNQTLTDKDRELIQRWHQNNLQKGKMPPVTPPGDLPPPPVPDPNRPPPTPPQQQPPVPPGQTPTGKAATPPADRPAQNMPDWMKKDLDRAARDFSKWLESPAGKSMRDRFGDAAKRFAEARNNAPPVGERMRGIGKYLPRPSALPNVAPRVSPSVRALPRVPSPGSMPRVSASGAGKTVVILAVAALLLFVVWQSRGWWADALATRLLGKGWKLGPWPVRPDQVTTRADLVRAFEYLALLNLGPAARVHHHLDLGREIGERPSLDPDRRRDAAHTLARLYEQARYAPDDEVLSPQDMADARRELGYLAGEMAA